MLEIRNHTPLTASLIPGLDKNGYDFASVIMKGKFTIVPGQSRLVFNEEPAEIVQGDVHYGEPEKTSVRYESDTAIYKRATDIVVNGHAYAPHQRSAYTVDVSVQVAKLSKTCRTFGDRIWERSSKSVMTLVPGQPQPFEKMPLVYERAYGGVDSSRPEEKNPEFSSSNPIGKGFVGPKGNPKEGLPLPNIEDPRYLIQKWEDRPAPAGFGFISRAWQPRFALAGTFDAQWKKKRSPLLPLDFNDRYFNGAHPDLITQNLLLGGEPVTLTNLSPEGQLQFDLPVWNEPVTFFIKGRKAVVQPVLDTVVIEPDDKSVLLTWRATVPCYKQFLYIDTVIIGTKRQTA